MRKHPDIVLNLEDPQEYQFLRADLISDYKPANTRENMLVDQTARAYWRLLRAERTETWALDDRLSNLARDIDAEHRSDLDPERGLAIIYATEPEKRFKMVAQQLRDAQREWYRAIREIETVQNRRFIRERREAKHHQAEIRARRVEQPEQEPQRANPPQPLPAAANADPKLWLAPLIAVILLIATALSQVRTAERETQTSQAVYNRRCSFFSDVAARGSHSRARDFGASPRPNLSVAFDTRAAPSVS